MSTDRVRKVAEEILTAFREGRLPAALAHTFIQQDQACYRWSRRNRLLAALHGHSDARGFKQWLAVDRHVRKGEKAFDILAPRFRRQADPGDVDDDQAVLIGWLAVPVFGYAQTDGSPIEAHASADRIIEALPVIDVARSWDIQVQIASIPGQGGSYLRGPDHPRILLGVRNLSTWSHAMVHVADHRLGYLTKGGQDLAQETVAEFGGAILLECLGETAESDRGGAYEYIERYAREHQRSAIDLCLQLMDRACECVELILRTAGQLPEAAAELAERQM